MIKGSPGTFRIKHSTDQAQQLLRPDKTMDATNNLTVTTAKDGSVVVRSTLQDCTIDGDLSYNMTVTPSGIRYNMTVTPSGFQVTQKFGRVLPNCDTDNPTSTDEQKSRETEVPPNTKLTVCGRK